ncbi:MAG: Lrp/AsnC family transcriptional regulator [Nanoarchaeota archaeon]
MNKIDHSLVFLRSENARMSFKEIARIVKKSPQLIKYNISVLQKEGILHDPYYIFDYSHFGLIVFRVYFKGVYIKEQDKLRVIAELRQNPYVLAIYDLVGEFDLGVEFAAPNPSKFNKEFKKIITANPLLKEYKIVLNIVTHIYPRNYLVNSNELLTLYNQKIVGGDREKEQFTPEEMTILRILLYNPTVRYTTLAKESDLNVKTAKSILRNLTKRNIIRGCKFLVNKNVLDITKSRLFLKLHNLDLEHESRFLDYLHDVPGVIQLNKTVGDWDVEIDLESLDKSGVRYIISKLREEFSDLISGFNLIEVYEYHKRTYLPEYLFKEE